MPKVGTGRIQAGTGVVNLTPSTSIPGGGTQVSASISSFSVQAPVSGIQLYSGVTQSGGNVILSLNSIIPGPGILMNIAGGIITIQSDGSVRGPTGPTGPLGPTGPQGAMGATGPTGAAADITSGEIIAALGYTPVTPTQLAGKVDLQIGINALGTLFGSTLLLDVTTNRINTMTLMSSLSSVTITAELSSNVYASVIFSITQGSSGGPYTITWPGNFSWQGGFTPALSTQPGATDVVQIMTFDSGTTWFATLALQIPAP